MELVEGSNIIVNTYKVQLIHDTCKKNPREMVRKLMKLIMGEDTLRKSSPTGKNGWDPIPSNIYEGVEQFVNNNAPKKKYRISHQEYRSVLTAMCATLRNPKTKQENEKSLKKGQNVTKKQYAATEQSKTVKDILSEIEEKEIDKQKENEIDIDKSDEENEKKFEKKMQNSETEKEKDIENIVQEKFIRNAKYENESEIEDPEIEENAKTKKETEKLLKKRKNVETGKKNNTKVIIEQISETIGSTTVKEILKEIRQTDIDKQNKNENDIQKLDTENGKKLEKKTQKLETQEKKMVENTIQEENFIKNKRYENESEINNLEIKRKKKAYENKSLKLTSEKNQSDNKKEIQESESEWKNKETERKIQELEEQLAQYKKQKEQYNLDQDNKKKQLNQENPKLRKKRKTKNQQEQRKELENKSVKKRKMN